MLFIFKMLYVVCVIDKKCNMIVYLIYSDCIVSGSLKNVVIVVLMFVGMMILVK